MYAAVNADGRIIAIHKKLDVVEEYIDENELQCHIIKIKKAHEYRLDTQKFSDLYLVKYRDKYVPESYSRLISRECSELEYIRDELDRLLEDERLAKKDRKYIAKTILVLERLLDDSEEVPESILDEISEMNNTYRLKIMEE